VLLHAQASCGVEIVDQDGGAPPDEMGDRGHLVAGLERDAPTVITGNCRNPQERSQQAVGVIVPGRGPGDVEDMLELVDPFPVQRARAKWPLCGCSSAQFPEQLRSVTKYRHLRREYCTLRISALPQQPARTKIGLPSSGGVQPYSATLPEPYLDTRRCI
jgi:hypothetical protein